MSHGDAFVSAGPRNGRAGPTPLSLCHQPQQARLPQSCHKPQATTTATSTAPYTANTTAWATSSCWQSRHCRPQGCHPAGSQGLLGGLEITPGDGGRLQRQLGNHRTLRVRQEMLGPPEGKTELVFKCPLRSGGWLFVAQSSEVPSLFLSLLSCSPACLSQAPGPHWSFASLDVPTGPGTRANSIKQRW